MVSNCYVQEKVGKLQWKLEDMKYYLRRANETEQAYLKKGHFCYDVCSELLAEVEMQVEQLKQTFDRVE